MTKDPLKRLTQHQTSERYWCELITIIKIERFDTQQQAVIAEKAAIINERPIHNKTHNRRVVQQHPTPNLAQVQKRVEPANTPNDRKAVRPKAASKILGVSLATVWRWLAERPDFPRSRKIGSRTTVFMVDELLQFMEACK